MKIDKPINENYAAVVVKIKNIVPLINCDNVVGTTILGMQAIVGKNTQIGDIGLFFPAECQLSDEYCYNNNLYRHADKNKVESEKGYIEDNRRVKAVKFRGNLSSCLFMPLESLNWTGVKISLLKEGDTFDKLKGKEICKKYIIYRKEPKGGQQAKKLKFIRVEERYMPENPDTAQFFMTLESLDPESHIIVTQKLHGTSIRIGHTLVKRRFNLFEFIFKKVGLQIREYDYDYVYGSRKVIKDINNPYQNHFYDEDIWTKAGKKLNGLLPQNYIVYGELVGYTEGGGEIQTNYTYNVEAPNCELYIYRIVIVNPQGILLDLNWNQIKEFCKQNGLNHVPEIWEGKLKDLKIENYLDKRFFEEGHRQCLYLGENKEIVDEGVCIRVEKLIPQILKAKSQIFLQHESKLLDQGNIDLESSQS